MTRHPGEPAISWESEMGSRSKWFVLMSCVAAAGIVACGDDDSDGGSGGTSGTGGTPNTGGATSTGGSAGSGGTSSAGSGGTTSTGGSAGSGGTTSTGGSAGSGGTTSTGGSAGSGGTTSTGGSAGAAGNDAGTCVTLEGGTVAQVLDCSSQTIAKTINISGFQFSPATETVKVNDVVKFDNADAAVHTSTSGTPACKDGGWDTGSIAGSASKCVKFTMAGTYPYFCTVHPSMTASITVTN